MLDPARTRAIWRSALIELAREGYDRLSMEAVARRAGVGKAALYRRWKGKESMIIALVSAIEIEIVSPPDQGSLRADLIAYIVQAYALLRRPLVARILPELYAEVSRDSDLAAAIRNVVLSRKRQAVANIVDRGLARGEIPQRIDHNLAFDLIVGPIYWRAVISRAPLPPDAFEETACRVEAALKAQCSVG